MGGATTLLPSVGRSSVCMSLFPKRLGEVTLSCSYRGTCCILFKGSQPVNQAAWCNYEKHSLSVFLPLSPSRVLFIISLPFSISNYQYFYLYVLLIANLLLLSFSGNICFYLSVFQKCNIHSYYCVGSTSCWIISTRFPLQQQQQLQR